MNVRTLPHNIYDGNKCTASASVSGHERSMKWEILRERLWNLSQFSLESTVPSTSAFKLGISRQLPKFIGGFHVDYWALGGSSWLYSFPWSYKYNAMDRTAATRNSFPTGNWTSKCIDIRREWESKSKPQRELKVETEKNIFKVYKRFCRLSFDFLVAKARWNFWSVSVCGIRRQ